MNEGDGDGGPPRNGEEPPHNVVRLGSEAMGAIGEELRRMYAFYVRQAPPDELAELMRRIERGEEVACATSPDKDGS
jgi:hypothetical protein